MESSKAVVSVLGIDKKGIIAQVSQVLFQKDSNILDISQTVVAGNYFNMVMVVDITGCDFSAINTALRELGEKLGMQIRIQKSEIFEAMHQV